MLVYLELVGEGAEIVWPAHWSILRPLAALHRLQLDMGRNYA